MDVTGLWKLNNSEMDKWGAVWSIIERARFPMGCMMNRALIGGVVAFQGFETEPRNNNCVDQAI